MFSMSKYQVVVMCVLALPPHYSSVCIHFWGFWWQTNNRFMYEGCLFLFFLLVDQLELQIRPCSPKHDPVI